MTPTVEIPAVELDALVAACRAGPENGDGPGDQTGAIEGHAGERSTDPQGSTVS